MDGLVDLIQTLKRQAMDNAVFAALNAVYEKQSIFDGYDAEGYLGCYESEMKDRGVSEDRMIKAFVELVDSELREVIQKLAKQFAHDWAKFAKATISEGSDFMEERYELKSYASKEEEAKQMTQEFLQSAKVQELVLGEFGLLLNDHFKQNDGLSVEDAMETVLSQNVSLELAEKL